MRCVKWHIIWFFLRFHRIVVSNNHCSYRLLRHLYYFKNFLKRNLPFPKYIPTWPPFLNKTKSPGFASLKDTFFPTLAIAPAVLGKEIHNRHMPLNKCCSSQIRLVLYLPKHMVFAYCHASLNRRLTCSCIWDFLRFCWFNASAVPCWSLPLRLSLLAPLPLLLLLLLVFSLLLL